jgi:hypothetical protein
LRELLSCFQSKFGLFPWDSETGSALTPDRKALELLSAAGTPASKVNVVVLNLETVAADIGPWEFVEARVLQVDDVAAIQADEVMVLVQLGVETHRGAGVAGLGQEAKGEQGCQDAIDGHARELGHARMNGVEDLVGGRVVPAVQNRLEHGPPLHGDRQPALAVGGLKALDTSLFLCRSHVPEMINYTG